MKIEDVEKLDAKLPQGESDCGCVSRDVAETAVEALRAEAWHPIEKAEELGAKEGRQILLWDGNSPFPCWYQGSFYDGKWEAITGSQRFPTHFRFINPPEGA